MECWVSINCSVLKLIMSPVTYLCVGPMEAILESSLLSLENVTEGHWNKYKLTGALSVFFRNRISFCFCFPYFFIKNFLVGELEFSHWTEGKNVTGATAKTLNQEHFSLIKSGLNKDFFFNYQETTRA